MSGAVTRADRRAWASARTLADVGELTARWIEGDVKWYPCYGDFDAEDASLIPVLARLNRAGFVTTASNPAGDGPGFDGARWRQRAAVEGFAGWEASVAIETAAVNADLVVVVHDPENLPRRGYYCGEEIAVTLRGGEEYTWFGQQVSRRDIRSRRVGWGTCHRDAVRALCGAWQVTVIDPEWGRDPSPLWGVLDAALNGIGARS